MKIYINKDRIILYLLLFISFMPRYFYSFSIGNIITKILQFIAVSFIFVCVIKSQKISKFAIILILVEIICLISTLIKTPESIFNWLYHIMMLFCIYGTFSIYIDKLKKEFIDVIANLFGIYAWINEILIILFPYGIWQDTSRKLTSYRYGYFLGIDNQMAYILIPTAIFVFLNYCFNEKKIYYLIFMTAPVILSIITLFPATAVVAITIFVLLASLVLVGIKWINSFINEKTIVLLMVFVFVLLIFIQSYNSIVTYVVERVLGKNMTFTGRFELWKAAIKGFLDSPLIGNGQNNTGTLIVDGMDMGASAHNVILQFIYEHGIVAIIIFLLGCKDVIKKMKIYNNQKEMKIILLGLFSIFVTFMMEVYSTYLLIGLLIVAYKYNELIETKHDYSETL